jgi:hypothetical protein
MMQNVVTNPVNKYQTKLPLSFIKNSGQEDIRAHFTTSYKGRRFFFSSDRITSVELEPIEKPLPESEDLRSGVAVELSFVNANPNLIPEGISPQSGYNSSPTIITDKI